MSNNKHTCDKCQHFKPDNLYANFGYCALMGDSNELEWDRATGLLSGDNTRAYGWDYEGYRAGVLVGHKFGCIHWIKSTN